MEPSYNPVLSHARLRPPRPLANSPEVSAGTAVVLARTQGGHVVLREGDRLTPGELRFACFREFFKVDVAEHRLALRVVLPGQDRCCDFVTTLRLVCRVRRPARIVEDGIVDVARVLRPALARAAKPVVQETLPESERVAARRLARALRRTALHPGFATSEIEVEIAALDGDSDDRAAAGKGSGRREPRLGPPVALAAPAGDAGERETQGGENGITALLREHASRRNGGRAPKRELCQLAAYLVNHPDRVGDVMRGLADIGLTEWERRTLLLFAFLDHGELDQRQLRRLAEGLADSMPSGPLRLHVGRGGGHSQGRVVRRASR